MALGDPYATPAQLEARLGKEDDGTFEQMLDVASRAVESFTGRQFNKAEEATRRRYRALDRERVRTDDFWTMDDLSVAVHGVEWDISAHIDARPWDGVQGGQIGWPFSDLFAINRSWPWSRRALVQVTAKWGWESVPSAIVEATLDVAEVMSQSLTSSGSGPVRGESMGGYAIQFATPLHLRGHEGVPPELLKALPYRRKRFGVA
jgi:hypothetical protein